MQIFKRKRSTEEYTEDEIISGEEAEEILKPDPEEEADIARILEELKDVKPKIEPEEKAA